MTIAVAINEDRIDPKPEAGSFPDLYSNAEEAFDAGNYAEAFLRSDAASPMRAMATIMCGAVAPGLEALDAPGDDRARLCAAYGHWCLGSGPAALAQLASIDGGDYGTAARALEALVAAPEIPVAVITMPGGAKAKGFAEASGFDVKLISLPPEDFGISWSELWAKNGGGDDPALIVGIDAFGPYFPAGLGSQGAPVALWSSDVDFFLASRHHDHASADIITVNSASECAELAARYGCRVASFPGHDSYAQNIRPGEAGAGDVDVLFTGRAFASYMRDKAQFLFALAAHDDPDIRMQFLDGYLSEDEYAERLKGARIVPTHCRYPGGMPTRTIDALRAGALVLTDEARSFGDFLGDGADPFTPVSGDWMAGPKGGYAAPDMDYVFWRSPGREERYLKFCLFQSLLAPRQPKPPARNAVPVELRGYEVVQGLRVYTRIANLNAANPETAANYNYAAAAAFYAAILAPEKTEFADLALQFYGAGMEAFPQSLMLRFNGAAVQWCLGHKNQASANFMAAIEDGSQLEFDVARDAPLSHRVRAISKLFPFGDYYGAAAGHDGAGANPKSILKSGAMTFLAADALDEGRLDQALELLDAASILFDRSAPVWRLAARARAAARSDAASVRQAFYRAVNLFPGELPGLLKIGIEAELGDGRDAEAADILAKWTRVASRVKTGDGTGYGVSPETLSVAGEHKTLLDGWTRSLLDRILDAGEGR
ncbi:MAG: hypothetical protein HOI98_21280 [Rhodospirillaceae bacterium]|nr:hypothetical protein [Rhodospirillaceae bacterium]